MFSSISITSHHIRCHTNKLSLLVPSSTHLQCIPSSIHHVNNNSKTRTTTMVYKNLLKKKINLSEFQRVVACVAYKSCAKDLTITQHQNAIYNCFHVKGDNASQFQLLIDGTNICYRNMLYEDVNCPRVADNSPINKRIVKPIYSPNIKEQASFVMGKR